MNGSGPTKDEKAFDCVAMKAEIQNHLVREVAELGEEEAPETEGRALGA